jgi:splicing factor 3B subunit 3
VFADDTVPRHTTAAANLDYDTQAGADRFGNVYVLRLPPELSAAVEEDPTAGKFAAESGALGGAPNRLQAVAVAHVGETVTALQRAAMQAGGREVVLYATINGALGALCPLSSREDVDFFQHLEMHMRQEAPPLLGRDHLSFRSAYAPSKDVLDGDLCAQFGRLPPERQRAVAAELDRTPGEVSKKIEDVANRII